MCEVDEVDEIEGLTETETGEGGRKRSTKLRDVGVVDKVCTGQKISEKMHHQRICICSKPKSENDRYDFGAFCYTFRCESHIILISNIGQVWHSYICALFM